MTEKANGPAPSGGATGSGTSTQEKPGTGRPQEPERPPQQPSGWSGSDRYPDGYEMGRNADGTHWLRNPEGREAYWNVNSERWMDSEGNLLPQGWEGGHYPDFFKHNS